MLTVAVAIVGGLIYTLTRPQKDKTYIPEELKQPHFTAPAAPTPIDEVNEYFEFDDGLIVSDTYESFELDQFGVGIEYKEEFLEDINGDGVTDHITKTHHATGDAHSSDHYQIQINQNGKLVDITPDGMYTIEGADCALQKFQFIFNPKFQVIKISRPMGETMISPTNATRTVYEIKDNKLVPVLTQRLGPVCDVEQLFIQ